MLSRAGLLAVCPASRRTLGQTRVRHLSRFTRGKMSTATWREEKSEYVVSAICRLLAAEDTPLSIKEELAGEALWNALKLFADAMEERLNSNSKWSPGLVELFKNRPERCKDWLELMSEPDFSAQSYWNGE
jgi:hypothetical protein